MSDTHSFTTIRDISAYRKTQKVQAQIPESPEVLVQATSWHRNTQGKIELVADKKLHPLKGIEFPAAFNRHRSEKECRDVAVLRLYKDSG
ncbi:MAG: hypothetical protein V7K27_20920 [Nostoc sp.]|uniref:hypothetical protein n=1 Tax=Nostoc sp. TaxID=1180 RepID=UPI002FF5744F